MADYLSTPKLPVNLSDIAADAKERVQRMLNAKKSRQDENTTDAADAELSDACRQMESLFIHHLFKGRLRPVQFVEIQQGISGPHREGLVVRP